MPATVSESPCVCGCSASAHAPFGDTTECLRCACAEYQPVPKKPRPKCRNIGCPNRARPKAELLMGYCSRLCMQEDLCEDGHE